MDEILSALACIPVRTCSYAEWLGIGMALKDAGYELSLIHIFCTTSTPSP